jgi:hypothetical protein
MTGFVGHSAKKAIEIWLHPSNFNRCVGFVMSNLFYTAKTIIEHMGKLKKKKNPVKNDQQQAT